MATSTDSAPTSSPPFLEIRPLVRALGIASDARKLILATIGLVALWAGWLGVGWVFGQPLPADIPTVSLQLDLQNQPTTTGDWLSLPTSMIQEPFRVLVTPFAALFVRGSGFFAWLQIALMAVWAVVVWGIVGGAIARIAIVQAAGDHRVGLLTALKFALGKSSSLIGAPLTPLFAVFVFAIPCALLGLMSRIPWGVGSTLSAVLGFVPLLLGLVMALILIGLALGWPLMHATVAAEGEDAPDAFSRSYSYVNQRLARYFAHALAGGLIGAFGVALVIAFANVVLILDDWGVGLGRGTNLDPTDGGRPFWRGAVGLVVHAWVYSYFWSSASIIYLILRRDVDGTTWHDVYLPEQDTETFAGDLDTKPVAEPSEVG